MRFNRAATVILFAAIPLVSHDTPKVMAQDASWAVLHVAQRHPLSSDRNGGTVDAPMRSIGEAVRRARRNRRAQKSTRVQIHPGIYRESIELLGDDTDSAARIVLEGAGADEAIVSGADVWTGWHREERTNLYRRPWPAPWQPPAIPDGWDSVRRHIETHPILLRGEMVRVDGEAFEHVFSQADLVARAGTFYIESQGLESTLWVHASTDLTQDRTTVEVSVRPTLFVANQIDHVEIRGLAFRHASTTLQDAAARIDGCSDVRVERCSFDQNSWNGLAVYQSRDVRLANVTANSNGAGGIQAWRVTDLELLDCESSHNNWRGARGDFTGWATGQKFFSIHGGRFVRYTAVGNHATGLWFDTDNRNIRLEDAHICQNDTRGVFLEASEGPFVLKNNRICDNGETGLMATGAARVSLDGNTIVENGEHQIFVPWLADEHVETTAIDYETRQSVRIRTTSWSLTNNVIGGADSALLFSVGRWPSFFDSLESDRNTWYQDGRRDGFAVYPDKGAAPERMDFEAWQLVSGQDRRSRFATRTESRP